jgi:hypothetical protein
MPDAAGLLGDGLLRLALGADEHDRPAVGDRLLDEVVGAVDVAQGLGQVDDVDAVALGEDEALHLRVPALGLVPEVRAALEQLAHGDDGHGWPLCAVHVGVRPLIRQARPRGGRLSLRTGWRGALVLDLLALLAETDGQGVLEHAKSARRGGSLSRVYG